LSLLCPGCKADIDDDAFFCDQCGAELLKCGRCGFVGKGKVCPHDRTPLMPAKMLGAGTGAAPAAAPSPGAGAAPSTPPARAPERAPSATPSPQAAASVARTLCLRSAAHGVELRPASGDLLGRRFGPHAGVLERFSQISSSHLELRRDASGAWFAKDLKSFNHSFYNGRQLPPEQEQALDAGATLSLGDVAFTVHFE
jgi:hypothetical protein